MPLTAVTSPVVCEPPGSDMLTGGAALAYAAPVELVIVPVKVSLALGWP